MVLVMSNDTNTQIILGKVFDKCKLIRCLLSIHNGFFFLIIRSVVSDPTMVAQDRLRNIYF